MLWHTMFDRSYDKHCTHPWESQLIHDQPGCCQTGVRPPSNAGVSLIFPVSLNTYVTELQVGYPLDT
jgi:hypothetical protein